jgi:hypothetical protein
MALRTTKKENRKGAMRAKVKTDFLFVFQFINFPFAFLAPSRFIFYSTLATPLKVA